jgi:hypothetical protein
MTESDTKSAGAFNDRRIKSNVVRGFYETWDALRLGRPAPARSDFLPETFAFWWPDMFLVDIGIEGEKPIFKYRLVGSGLEDRLGRGLGGRSSASTIGDGEMDNWLGSRERAYQTCFETMSPVHQYLRFKTDHGTPGEFERLLLPLSNDGRTVVQLLGVVIYQNLQTNRAR